MAKKKDYTIFWILGIVILLLLVIMNNSYNNQKKQGIDSVITIHYYGENGKEIWPDGTDKFLPYAINKPQEGLNFSSLNDFITSLINLIKKLIKGDSYAIVAYTSQCSLPACPVGYLSTGTSCDDSSNKCTRTCEQVVPSACGTYGSSSQVKYLMVSSPTRGTSYSTPSYYVNSNTCYRFYAQSYFSVSSWGGATCYSVTANGPSGLTKTICSTSSSATSTTTTFTLGRGTDGSSYSASGKFIDYTSGSTCSSGYPIFKMSGSLTPSLFAATAPWISAYTNYATKTCTYACDKASECGTNGYINSPICISGNVYQDYRTYSCSSYSCSSSIQSKLKQTCIYGCTNGICNEAPSCTPTTCALLEKTCGTWNDGCEGTLNCGTCSIDEICNNGICQLPQISFSITVTNTGQVQQINISISDSDPIELKNALIDNTPFNLNDGEVKIISTNKFNIQSAWKPTKTFIVNVTGTDVYTLSPTTIQASIPVTFP